MRMTTEVAAATAGAMTEAPRDLPNVPADRQALGLVRPYLGMVAWPTVFVAVAIVAAFATVTTLGAIHIIPLWLGLILNTFILYLDQTPLHEACHGNIAGKDQRCCGSIIWSAMSAARSCCMSTKPSATCILPIIATPTTRSSTPIIG